MPDQLLPQPPPDAPAPPAGEHALRSRRNMRWLIAVGIICMIFATIKVTGVIKNETKAKAEAKETESNLRELGTALHEFDTAYGKFPHSSTYPDATESSGLHLGDGDGTSNELFTQFFFPEITTSENMFYASVKSSKRPDNVFVTSSTALEHGECVFAYIYGLSSKDLPDTPLVFGPVIPGTHDFDKSANYGKILVLTVDNSLVSYPIDTKGKVTVGGMDFLDPRQPFWHGKAPDVKWPK